MFTEMQEYDFCVHKNLKDNSLKYRYEHKVLKHTVWWLVLKN